MIRHPGNGIYQSRSTYGPETFFEHRNIYIQGDCVRLVNTVAKPEHQYDFNFWFEVNQLGDRIGDLPDNFDIYKDY